jgi:predicted Zn-dependent protease
LQSKLVWRARDVALTPAPTVALEGRDHQIVATVPTPTMQKLLLAHLRITRNAGVQAELVLVEGDDPNAFAGLMNGRRVIGINVAMIKLIGDDLELYAALLGHETAHWAKGHVDAINSRSTTIQGIGTAIGVGLGAVGVPAAGLIAGLGADMVEASYSRDDEREADAASIDYMIMNGFDPAGAVRLQEKLLNVPGGVRIPFLSSHPSGEERIENLKKIIAAKQAQPK